MPTPNQPAGVTGSVTPVPSTTTSPKLTPPAERRRRLLLGVSLAMIVPSWYFIWNHFQTPSIAVERATNRPLLKTTPGEYRDADIGLRFTPPPKWSMQMTSKEDTENPVKERIAVKFKRVVDKLPAAWFRVTIVNDPVDEPIQEAVRKRDPGRGWKAHSGVDPVTVAGHTGAKIQYAGDYNGAKSIREIVGIRRGQRLFVFTATFQIADRAAQIEARQAIQSALFEDQ